MIGLGMLAAALTLTPQVNALAARAGLAGEVLIAKGNTILLDKAYGTVDPRGSVAHRVGARWRIASITKQVAAAEIVRSSLAKLDVPFGSPSHFPTLGNVTLRQLLTHHSGLPNPDATPATAGGVPSFYTSKAGPDLRYCMAKLPEVDRPFSYNNCDYLIAGTVLLGDMDTIGPVQLWRGMTMARPGEIGVPGYVKDKPEPHYELANFGTAGGVIGTARAVFDFDRALMTGKLLSPAALAELWKPEGNGSYQALGAWVFPGKLKGCAALKRIVQRDGEIGGVQTRNYILPDDDIVVVVFTNRSSDDFQFGEIWQGKGFAYDLLSAVACS